MSSRFSKLKFGILISCVMVVAAVLFYLIIRITLLLLAEYPWYDKILALFLLFAELLILIHTIGYALNVFIVILYHGISNTIPSASSLKNYPPIAIVVAAYKEPISILRDTLTCFYNINYPNKHLYFLDDTRYDLPWDTPENKQKYRQSIEELCQWFQVNLFRSKWHGAKAGKINDFINFLAGNPPKDVEFYPYGSPNKKEVEKYLIIFDADMNALPTFADDVIPIMEERPKVAFVQTPQYYTNFPKNRVAHASGVQQAIFYEYICEGKSLKNAMFCCGTNVLFRIEALLDVGGFDENSVTEDFATSLKLHGKGWNSIYLNKVLAFGMGPEDLGAYFKQQFRWASGTIGILKELPRAFWKNFRQFSLGQWWEYLLASTHYLIGWVYCIMILGPIFFLLWNVPSYFASPEMYFIAYLPYLIMTSLLFFGTMKQKQYHPSDLFLTLFFTIISFPVYARASVYGLLGIKTSFGITPKGNAHILPLSALRIQIFFALLCLFALVWGFQRLYYEEKMFYAILMNIVWTFYHFCVLCFFLYFNHSVEGETV